jgi:hypothetical protein
VLIGIVIGAAGVGAWWWWIGHKAKVRALAALAQSPQKTQGKG